MVQNINDRNVASRDTVAQPGRLGAMAMTTADQTSAPTSVGQLASPSTMGNEPPPTSVDELNSRVSRNTAFLQDPNTKAQLLQFGMSMLGSAGRGNFGTNISNALTSSRQLPARAAMMNLKYNKEVQGMDIAERGQQVQEEQLGLDKTKLKLDILRHGGGTFTRVISSDDPINQSLHLGIPDGTSAKVNFVHDLNGNIQDASVDSEFGGQGGDDIGDLLRKADAAEQAGRPQEANLFRMEAQTKAVGAGGITSKGGVLASDPNNPNNPTGMVVNNIPGSENAIAATTAQEAKDSRTEEARMQATFALDNIDRATTMIQDSIAPNYLVTGWGSLLSYLPNTTAADFSTAIDTIKAHNTVRQLTLMREGSKSGASGLGQVTEFEDRMLSSMLGSLEQKQSAQSMLHNLRSVRKVYDAIINTGALAEIGKKVDSKSMTYDEGIAAAAGALSSGGNATLDPRATGEEPIPLPAVVPGMSKSMHDQLGSVWDGLSNEDRQQFLVNPNKF